MTKQRLSKKMKLFLDALEAAKGNVSLAAEGSGISRQSHYNWLKDNATYAEKVEDINESMIDLAETKLFLNINQGNQRAIEYFLDRKARHKGYGQHLALTGKDGQPIEIAASSPEKIQAARQQMDELFPEN